LKAGRPWRAFETASENFAGCAVDKTICRTAGALERVAEVRRSVR